MRGPRSLVPSNAHATRTAHARAMLAMLKAMCARDAREMLTRCSRDAHEMMPLVTLDVQTPPATAKGTPL